MKPSTLGILLPDPQQSITINRGLPISDNENSLKAGARGPTLIEDFILREKTTHGIDFSNDPLLQGCLHSCQDTQLIKAAKAGRIWAREQSLHFPG